MELPAAGSPSTWMNGNSPAPWQEGHLYLYECWATWCGPCIASMPHLEELHRSLRQEKTIHILGLNLDNDMTPDRLGQFVDNKLRVTFPIGIASQQTQELWLKPLDVRAIPFAFAVRDGKLVWKGSPRQLTGDMLKRLAQGREATDGPPPDPERQRQDMLACVRGVFEALARRDVAEAKRIAAEEDARRAKTGPASYGMTLFLLRSMVSNGFGAEAIAEATELAKRQPGDPVFLLKIADALSGPFLQTGKSLEPADRPVLEAALGFTRQADGLEEQAGKRPQFTPLMMADLLEKLGRNVEAKPYLLQGIKRSECGKAWEEIQQALQENISLQEILEGSVKAVVAMEKASSPEPLSPPPTRWEEAGKKDPMSAVFERAEWKGEFKPQSPPAHGTLLISTRSNASRLEAKLRLHGWNRPSLYRAILTCGPQLAPASAQPEPTYPVGQLSDPEPLLRLLKIESTPTDNRSIPEVILWRDGCLLWHGETAFMPAWIGETLDQQDFDISRFQQERRQEEERLNRLKALVKQAIALNREEKWDEARALLAEHLDELYAFPSLALFAEEHLAGKDFHNKDYDAVNKRFRRLMKSHPLEFVVYSSIHKALGSNPDLQSACYATAMDALQGMADTNLRADPEYNAACFAVMARLALTQNQQARARELGLRALATSALARRYLGIKP